MDFYTFDLLNGLHHGHAPSQCRNCEKYFLTATGHTPKYCDGIALQDSRLTCRQYGARYGDKESNSNHPIYIRFSTGANTIRKRAERGKIDQALNMATELEEKVFMDSGYDADGYQRDMEPEPKSAWEPRRHGHGNILGGADRSNEELAM